MSTRSGSAKPESACTNSRWSAWRLGGSWGVPAAATFSLCIDYEDRYVGRRYAGDAGGLGKRPRLEAEDLLTSLTRQLPERLRVERFRDLESFAPTRALDFSLLPLDVALVANLDRGGLYRFLPELRKVVATEQVCEPDVAVANGVRERDHRPHPTPGVRCGSRGPTVESGARRPTVGSGARGSTNRRGRHTGRHPSGRGGRGRSRRDWTRTRLDSG